MNPLNLFLLWLRVKVSNCGMGSSCRFGGDTWEFGKGRQLPYNTLPEAALFSRRTNFCSQVIHYNSRRIPGLIWRLLALAGASKTGSSQGLFEFLRAPDPRHNISSGDIITSDMFSQCQYWHKTGHRFLQVFLTLPQSLFSSILDSPCTINLFSSN